MVKLCDSRKIYESWQACYYTEKATSLLIMCCKVFSLYLQKESLLKQNFVGQSVKSHQTSLAKNPILIFVRRSLVFSYNTLHTIAMHW